MPSQLALALFYQTVLGYPAAGLPRENLLRLNLLGYPESTLNSDSNKPPNSNMQNKVFDDKINWLSFIRRCWVTQLGYPEKTYSDSTCWKYFKLKLKQPTKLKHAKQSIWLFYQTVLGYPTGLPRENLLRINLLEVL